jgi:hypothetical protein
VPSPAFDVTCPLSSISFFAIKRTKVLYVLPILLVAIDDQIERRRRRRLQALASQQV